MKRCVVEGFFPELRGKCDLTGRGTGGSNKVAIARAFGDLLKQPKVKGKSITTIRAVICLSEVVKCDLCGYEVCRCAGPEEGAGEQV
jgi:hypothetical protein